MLSIDVVAMVVFKTVLPMLSLNGCCTSSRDLKALTLRSLEHPGLFPVSPLVLSVLWPWDAFPPHYI